MIPQFFLFFLNYKIGLWRVDYYQKQYCKKKKTEVTEKSNPVFFELNFKK